MRMWCIGLRSGPSTANRHHLLTGTVRSGRSLCSKQPRYFELPPASRSHHERRRNAHCRRQLPVRIDRPRPVDNRRLTKRRPRRQSCAISFLFLPLRHKRAGCTRTMRMNALAGKRPSVDLRGAGRFSTRDGRPTTPGRNRFRRYSPALDPAPPSAHLEKFSTSVKSGFCDRAHLNRDAPASGARGLWVLRRSRYDR
jgi:hypothetical protein